MVLRVLFFGIKPSDNLVMRDYIVNTVLGNYKCVIFYDTSTICDVLVYTCVDPSRQSIYGYSPSYRQVEDIVVKLKPKIIIQLADECPQEHNEVHNLLGYITNLFLRCHRHESQLYTYTSKVEAIPLGYSNYIDLPLEIKAPQDRKYTWTWTGTLRPDRKQMIQEFWRMWNNATFAFTNLNKEELGTIYNNSVFVPCGRGNFSLDCYRQYEATIYGAIPVVMSSVSEFEATFKFFDELPPWIVADTWEQAVTLCQQVQFDYPKLLELQTNNLAWWHRMVSTMHSKITQALSLEVVQNLDILELNKSKVTPPQSVVYYPGDTKRDIDNRIFAC